MIKIKGNPLKNYKFIDLFCGIGGFHLALKSFGAECVFACDIDSEARKVYANNFGITPKSDILEIKNEDIPHHDILCAGFPCQPFSISGHRKGFSDELGRGKLFFEIIRIAKHHKPKIILLENVKNLEKHDNSQTLTRINEELANIGYTVYSKVLCASDYNIPQERKRIYIVAFRNDLGINNFSFPQKHSSNRYLTDILLEEGENEIDGNYIIKREYVIDPEKNNDTPSAHLKRIGSIGLGRQGERIYSIFGQGVTLSSQGGGLGGKTGMYLINGTVRKLYPRECARLMGFPDEFKVANTQERNYKQFGNSVVVDVLQYILVNILDVLKGEL
ncbi:MAG: DNA cytosine methyltransferase [Clostridia bacterium]|nr:DNA cytosine methyltransferase [Clostridia bacterium]